MIRLKLENAALLRKTGSLFEIPFKPREGIRCGGGE
jgi:hypothetical protein